MLKWGHCPLPSESSPCLVSLQSFIISIGNAMDIRNGRQSESIRLGETTIEVQMESLGVVRTANDSI